MSRPASIATLFLLGLSCTGFADTIVVDSIHQESPPGSINNEQTIIINNDAFGNQRILRIGTPGGIITRAKPCKRDKPVAGMNCTNQDLRNVKWDGARLSGSQFDGADLRGASLVGAKLVNASFNDARLDNADLSRAQLINGDFNSASLTGTRLRGAEIVNGSFMDADLSGSDLANATLINAEFMAARLGRAIWTDGSRCRDDSVGGCLH